MGGMLVHGRQNTQDGEREGEREVLQDQQQQGDENSRLPSAAAVARTCSWIRTRSCLAALLCSALNWKVGAIYRAVREAIHRPRRGPSILVCDRDFTVLASLSDRERNNISIGFWLVQFPRIARTIGACMHALA